jgi:poly(A) polymerase
VPALTEVQQNAVRELLRVAPVAGELGERFAAAGSALHLVGGSVRDALLGRLGDDLDFTTDARPPQVQALLEGWAESTWETGIAFGTVGAQRRGFRIEITTYRAEAYDRSSRNPVVRYGDSLADDLARRDFAVNAMAVALPDWHAPDAFVDPYGGLDELSKLLLGRFPRAGLELLVDTGLADAVLPELPALRLEIDEWHQHKDVYDHTLQVLERAIALEEDGPDLVLRLAALLHDIGKPRTRRKEPGGGVSFHHHEVVGASMVRRRLQALRFPKDVVSAVARLTELHLRFHGYRVGGPGGSADQRPGAAGSGASPWTDSAVRRYVTDAGDQLARLHKLVRSDCTTRNRRRAAALAAAYDDLEARIARLAEQEELGRIRPDLSGDDIMALLGLPPGPLVGQARKHLLELRMERGPLPREQAEQERREWAGAHGVQPPG